MEIRILIISGEKSTNIRYSEQNLHGSYLSYYILMYVNDCSPCPSIWMDVCEWVLTMSQSGWMYVNECSPCPKSGWMDVNECSPCPILDGCMWMSAHHVPFWMDVCEWVLTMSQSGWMYVNECSPCPKSGWMDVNECSPCPILDGCMWMSAHHVPVWMDVGMWMSAHHVPVWMDVCEWVLTMSQSGWMWFTPMYSTKLANPSFNQTSSHHFIVTKFPNHCNQINKLIHCRFVIVRLQRRVDKALFQRGWVASVA